MQKPKSLEQIANELAAKREPIKMEPKKPAKQGIDLSRAAGMTKPTQAAQKSQQNLGNSRIPQSPKNTQNSQNLGNSRTAVSNPAQKIAQQSSPKQQDTQKAQAEQSTKDEKIVIKPKITTFRDDISALYETPVQNLSPASLFIALGIAFLVMIATLPKVFIANEIYYTSRDIGTLRDKLGVLNEENRELKSKLEQIRYQNQVIDNLR